MPCSSALAGEGLAFTFLSPFYSGFHSLSSLCLLYTSISDVLLGAFFEDINYSADGGLYAELIQILAESVLASFKCMLRKQRNHIQIQFSSRLGNDLDVYKRQVSRRLDKL